MANLVAKFKLEKQKEINAVFKIQKVVPADGIEEQLQAEIDRATAKEQELQENIDGVSSSLDFEIQARENADTQLDEKIDGININLTRQIDDLEQDVNDKYNELTRDIDDLTDVVEENFSTLDTKINTSVTTINQRITDVADEINQTLTNHNTRITDNSNAIAQEIFDRQNGDDILTGEIENIAGELDSKQNILVSGQNIKTINNQSILGDGNIDIQGGGASSFAELEGDPYDNQALANVLNSLDIISLLSVYLKDSFGYNLLDKNGLTLLARR